jgi:hypothetical protein
MLLDAAPQMGNAIADIGTFTLTLRLDISRIRLKRSIPERALVLHSAKSDGAAHRPRSPCLAVSHTKRERSSDLARG